MKKTKSFLEWNEDIFISSIKRIDSNIFLIVILDILFYFLSGYVALFWLQRVQASITTFNLPQDAVSLGYEKLQELLSSAKLLHILIIGSLVLLVIIVIFLASVLKGIIWAKTTKTKITFALISKFLLLNLIWMGFWFAIIILISIFIEPQSAPVFMTAAIMLGLYFTNTLYAIFMKKPMLKSIITAVKVNVLNIRLFLLPYAVIILILFIIARGTNLLAFRYSTILGSLVIIVYVAIVRYYVSNLVVEIEKNK